MSGLRLPGSTTCGPATLQLTAALAASENRPASLAVSASTRLAAAAC